jgi:hypothetical protein
MKRRMMVSGHSVSLELGQTRDRVPVLGEHGFHPAVGVHNPALLGWSVGVHNPAQTRGGGTHSLAPGGKSVLVPRVERILVIAWNMKILGAWS